MGDEQFEGFDRVSQVAGFIKTDDFIRYVERTDKRERTAARNKAFKVGTRVDELIKTEFLPTKKDSVEVHNCHKAFQKWKQNYNPHMMEVGERLFNKELGITGEIDLFINGEEISDIKCSTEIRPEYWIQVGGYLWIREARKVSIIRLCKTTADYEYLVRYDVDELKQLFLSALNIYRFYKGGENGE